MTQNLFNKERKRFLREFVSRFEEEHYSMKILLPIKKMI